MKICNISVGLAGWRSLLCRNNVQYKFSWCYLLHHLVGCLQACDYVFWSGGSSKVRLLLMGRECILDGKVVGSKLEQGGEVKVDVCGGDDRNTRNPLLWL